MNFNAEATAIMDELGKRFGILVDWSNENVMPYIQDLGNRIIDYEIISSTVWMCISLICIITFVMTLRYPNATTKIFDSIKNFSGMAGLLCIFWVCSVIGSVICICVQIFDIAQCLAVPEIVYIDYIKNIIGQK